MDNSLRRGVAFYVNVFIITIYGLLTYLLAENIYFRCGLLCKFVYCTTQELPLNLNVIKFNYMYFTVTTFPEISSDVI